ncbi:recombinase family protein [Georgenia sp. SUBG003]|uniref:recombinase family protein n=1 Tax=Georgenia sp. SUBG003 TaxID=1497974 RepID=UPI003AB56B13
MRQEIIDRHSVMFESISGLRDLKEQSLIGLARVSTNSQDLQLQRDAFEAASCIRIFEEKVSSRSSRRPGLEQALDFLRDGSDTLVVWKLDRLGRRPKRSSPSRTV